MKSLDLRNKFFSFFEKHYHTKVQSSSLVPADDPTLLFANAGMNQFKDVFLGQEQRPYTRAVSIQKCIRAGGKHNDLGNVGLTKRHLTFFEMMGNFSFGDYFKHDAIRFAWEFVTEELKLNKDLLYATVFEKDDEAYNIWHQDIGLPEKQIVRLGSKDNFWQMGDTGPCGPCTELYIDRGLSFGCGSSTCQPGCDCDRFLEFWNLVFMQFDRKSDGSDVPLLKTGVDTGMGLERLATIMQKVDSVFETDLFSPLIAKIEHLTGIIYKTASEKQKTAFRVLIDHIRSATFAIADGALPSNEGRGYVIRRIIRRAALFNQHLTDKNIFAEIANPLIESMGTIYPELIKGKEIIKKILTEETEKFSANLISGQTRLAKYLEESKDSKIISGAQAFKLYDTYGFPLELTIDIAKEHTYTVDAVGFEAEMENQRLKSGKKTTTEKIELPSEIHTTFTGYQELTTTSSIIGIIKDTTLVQSIDPHTSCIVITQKCPFFVEKGGQVSDQGTLNMSGHTMHIEKLAWIDKAIGMYLTSTTKLCVGQEVTLEVDRSARLNTMKNHTATHLLQSALINILGPEVRQSGSLVHPDYLRFDFTYSHNLTSEQITEIEKLVNEKIMDNIATNVFETSYQEALDKGVIAIFDEKYNPEKVRVVDIPGFSAELCGGTHVHATGEIGCFKIIDSSALSAGNRRIFAITGPKAIELFQHYFITIKKLSQEFKIKPEELIPAIEKQRDQLKESTLALKETKKKIILDSLQKWTTFIEEINTIPFLFLALDNGSLEEFKFIADQLNQKKPGFYFITGIAHNAHIFYGAINPQLQQRINLKSLALPLKEQFSLKGGGSELHLQGSGPIANKETLSKFLQSWIKQQTP